MGTETDAIAPASALRRGLLRAGLVHATEAELDWLITEAGTVEGARRQAFQGTQLPMIIPLTILNVAIGLRQGGLLIALLVATIFLGFLGTIGRAVARRIDPLVLQRQLRTLKRKPSADDPTLLAGAPKRRRNVWMFRAAVVVYIPVIALAIAAPWLDGDHHGYVKRFGIDEPNADVQVEAVECLLDATHLLRLTATLVNNTDLDYTVTLHADVRTADNGYDSMEQVRVSARSSDTRLDTITGLTDPATRCELTVVKREQYPEAMIGGSILDGDGRG